MHRTRVAIRDVTPGGMTRVRGRVREAAGAVVAPLSGRQVVACQSVIVGFPLLGGDTNRLAEEQWAQDFILDDETGSIRVRASEGAQLQLAVDRRWDNCGGFPRKLPLVLRANERKTFMMGTSAWEGLVVGGSVVEVTGWCQLEPDPNPPTENIGYRDSPGMRPVLVAPPKGKLLIATQLAIGGPKIETLTGP